MRLKAAKSLDNAFANYVVLPARQGCAYSVSAGNEFKIIQIHGPQVVDAWAFSKIDASEYMSMEHSRSCLEKLTAGVGESMYSNRRRPIVTVIADNSPGTHDTLLSACDADRYRLLGYQGAHESCADNFAHALASSRFAVPCLPSPWNLFENVTIDSTGALTITPPSTQVGDYIHLRAEMDLIVVLSACPMDIVPTNGPDCLPKSVAIEFREAGTRVPKENDVG
jgi:uncharacterized protein